MLIVFSSNVLPPLLDAGRFYIRYIFIYNPRSIYFTYPFPCRVAAEILTRRVPHLYQQGGSG